MVLFVKFLWCCIVFFEDIDIVGFKWIDDDGVDKEKDEIEIEEKEEVEGDDILEKKFINGDISKKENKVIEDEKIKKSKKSK